MQYQSLLRFLNASVLALVWGCSTSSTVEGGCTPNDQQACECDAGVTGTQTCSADGTAFGACMCGSGGTGGSAGAAGNGATGGTGGSATGGTGGTGGETLDCTTYCDRIDTNCDTVLQYTSRDACEAVCASFIEGTLGEMGGNTLACRIYHAGVAADNANVHCPHAGPAGAGTCGDNCDSYCNLMLGICPGMFANRMDCESSCGQATDAREFDFTVATDSQGAAEQGPLFCRISKAVIAAEAAMGTASRTMNCEHAGPESALCGPFGSAGAGGSAGSGG